MPWRNYKKSTTKTLREKKYTPDGVGVAKESNISHSYVNEAFCYAIILILAYEVNF